ncbi:Chromodomain helicase hrp1 [Balamuthia mandrillaris]
MEYLPNKIYVKGLRTGFDKKHVRDIFGRYGNIVSIFCGTHDFAFVEFDSEEAATKAIEHENKQERDGITMKVCYAQKRQPRPDHKTNTRLLSSSGEREDPLHSPVRSPMKPRRARHHEGDSEHRTGARDRDRDSGKGKGKDGDRHTDRDRDRDRNRERMKDRNRPDVRLRRSQELPHRRSMLSNRDDEPDRSEGNQAARQRVNPSSSNWSQRNEPFYSFEPPQHPSSTPPPIQLPPSPSPQYRPPSPPSQLPPSFVTLFESMQPSDLLSVPFPLSQHTSSYVPQDTSPFITHDSPLFLPQGAVPQGTGTSPSLKDLNPAQLVALLALINRVGVTQVARAALLTALASAQSGEAAPSSNAVDSNSLPPLERSFGDRTLSPLGLEEMSWSTDKSANVQNFSTASSATKETRPTSSPPSYPPPPAYPPPSQMDNSRPLEPPPDYHSKTLLIRNCPLQTPQEYINMFSVYGTISNLRGISENRQGGDVFIEFEQEDAATLTVAQMDGITLKGHTVHVSFASRELLSRSYESSEAKRRSPDRHTRRGNRSHFSEPSREERSHRRYDDRDRRHPRDSPTAREKSERKHGKHEHRDSRHHSDSSTTREDDKSGKDRERHYRESSTTRKERHSSVQTDNGAAVMDQPSQDVRETNHNTPLSPKQEDEKKETNVLRRKRRLRKVVSVEQALPDITATLYKEEDLALSENNTNGLDTVGVGRWMCKRCGFKNNIRTECEVCEWTSDLKKKQTRKKEQKTTPTQLHNIANQEHDEHQTEGQQKNHTHNNNLKPTKDSSTHGDNSVNDKFAEAKQPVSSLASLTAKGLKHRILNNALSVPPSEQRDEKCTYCHQCHASFSIHNHQACISCTSCNLCYCFSCLRQHYQTIFPNLDSVAQSSPTNNGTSLHAVTETSSWSCPKCKNACTCSSCHTANGSASKTSPPTKTTPKLRIKKAGVEQTNKRQQDNKEEPPVKRRRRFSGKITLPFTREGTTVLSLGKVVYDRSHFHNTKYIWPVGFTSIREFNSSAPGGRSVYTCEIVDNGGPRPEFRITTKDDPSLKVNGKSASAAWKQLWEIFRSPHMSGHISGPALFGFSPQVKAAIENLPNAEKCANYEFVYREVDQKKRSRSTSKGNKPEKTERKVKRRRTSTARQAMKEERNEMKAKEESPSSSTNKAGTTQTQPEADQLITLGPDEWMCTACTYINKGRDKVVCGMCATSWFGWGNESQRAPLPQNNVSAPSKRRTASLKALLTMGDVHEYTSQQSPVKQRSRSRSDEPSSRTGTRRGRGTTSTTRRGPGRPRKSETMAKTSKRQKNEEREEREEEEDDQKEENQLGFETEEEEEEEEEEDWSSDLDGIEEVEEWAMIAAEKADDDDNNSSEEAEEEEDDLSESDRDGDETNANEEHSIVYYERNDEDDDGFVIYERKVERPPDPTHRLPPSSQRHSPSTPSSSTATTSTSFATTGFSPDPTLLQTLVFAAESTANNNNHQQHP